MSETPSYKDGKKIGEPKLLITKQIDWPNSHLDKSVKNFRFCTDEEGNVWAMPIIPYHYNPATDKQVEGLLFPVHQADQIVAQVAVQNVWITLLPTTPNVRIYAVMLSMDTAIETLECEVTIDGQVYDGTQTNAVIGTVYLFFTASDSLTAGKLNAGSSSAGYGFMMAGVFAEGRSVRVRMQKTTAVGGGTLTGKLIWAQYQ